MAISRPTPYAMPSSATLSPIIIHPPDTVPATDELEATVADLLVFKTKSLERVKKAAEDRRITELGLRRAKELEKGKAKAAAAAPIVVLDKVKREQEYISLPEDSSPPNSGKPRFPSIPLQSSSTRSSVVDDAKRLKKKKRKRELEESEGEPEQRPKKSSPPPPHSQPPKAQKTTAIVAPHPKPTPSTELNFSVHTPYPPIPPPPVYASPPVAGPSKPTEVTEDFSKLKPPGQTVITTFFSSIEPYVRNLREEDVGWLEWNGDELEPFVIPKLGRWYKDVWDEADAAMYGGPTPSTSSETAHPQAFRAPIPSWDPSTLSEADVTSENVGHGPLTERLISALLPISSSDNAWKGVKAAEDAMEGRPGGSGAAAARKERMNVGDLETRVRDTMRYYGLLDISEKLDFDNKVDDPVTTSLRKAQAELRAVLDRNKDRKARLVALARDRLAYQEYVELRESIDRNITNTYNRLQKRDQPKPIKKKKKLTGAAATSAANAAANAAALLGESPYKPPLNGVSADDLGGVPPPCPAALGLGPDDDYALVVPDNLKALVRTRRDWVDKVGKVFEERQAWALPKESVFAEGDTSSALQKMEVD